MAIVLYTIVSAVLFASAMVQSSTTIDLSTSATFLSVTDSSTTATSGPGASSIQTVATGAGGVHVPPSGSIQSTATDINLPSSSNAPHPPPQTSPQTDEEIVNAIKNDLDKVDCNYTNNDVCKDLVPAIRNETDKISICKTVKIELKTCVNDNIATCPDKASETVIGFEKLCSGYTLLQVSVLTLILTIIIKFL